MLKVIQHVVLWVRRLESAPISEENARLPVNGHGTIVRSDSFAENARVIDMFKAMSDL